MAANQGKHSVPGAQGLRRARAATNPHASTKPQASAKPKASAKFKAKPRNPTLPKPVIARRGKTTIRRYPGRSFHRFEEVKGKPVDFVEVYTTAGYHSIDVRFQDKTALHLIIEPNFTLEVDYSDWKTGNWRPIKRWPIIRSAAFNA